MAVSPTLNQAMSCDLSYCREDWQRGYNSLYEEFDYWIDQIEGIIPPELEGTLFRNGPSLLDVKGQPIHHPVDVVGLVSAIAFTDGKAHFRNRYVRTAGYEAEQQAGKIVYRGVFGTQKPGGWLANAFDLRIKNIANTNVIYWGGKLLALWEAAEPYQLDPHTLETIRLDDLGGILQPSPAFSAHPWVDPACVVDGSPRLVNFAIKPGLSTTITRYELDEAGKLVDRSCHDVPGFAFIHDFAITPHYCVFFQNPVRFNPLPYLLGWRSAAECIQFQPDQKTRIVVIPRFGKGSAQMIELQAGFVFHHANAFEQSDSLVVDSVCYADLPSVQPDADFRQTDFSQLAPGQLWRTEINLKTETAQRRLLEARCCEFPTRHPARVGQPYRYLYLAAAHAPTGNGPHQAIIKVDVESNDRQIWSAATKGYVGEPVFIPRQQSLLEGAEDDGWVVTLVFDASHDRSDVVILDARNLNQGPIARLHLKHHIPYGLHGSFTSQCFLP